MAAKHKAFSQAEEALTMEVLPLDNLKIGIQAYCTYDNITSIEKNQV